MKKMRFIALILVIIFCIPLMPGAAASTTVLTAVNDRFLPLTASSMPVKRSGEWYVPYTAFDSFAISAALQENGDVLVMQNPNTTLTFSLSEGYVYDHTMNSFPQPAYQINGIVYVPVKLVCGLFGLSFSLIVGDYQMLRIVDDNAALSDHIFVTQMAADAQKLVDAYKGIGTPHKPSVPSTPDSKAPEPVPPEQTIQPARIRPRLIYLTFVGAPTEYSFDLLDTLSAHGRRATFFLPADISWDADFVRRAVCEGHAIGLLITPDQAEHTAQLTQANASLFALTGLTTRLLTVSGGRGTLSALQKDAVTHAGYRLWDATVTANDETRRAAEVANLMLRSFDGTTATTVLSMHHTRSTNAALTLILRDLQINRVETAPVWACDTPVSVSSE